MILLTTNDLNHLAPRFESHRSLVQSVSVAGRIKRILSDFPRAIEPERYRTVFGGR